jgi:hypothetical protein
VPGSVLCTSTNACNESLTQGTKITLTASPNAGYQFATWTGSSVCGGNNPTCAITMNAAETVKANFTPLSPATGQPIILFTDIASGPTTGGENNDGVYLSIFGKNFGTSVSNIKVTIGGQQVARVISLGLSRVGAVNGFMPFQEVVVQVGSLGGAAKGSSLQVILGVDTGGGVYSNSNPTSAAMFMPTPGRILFVSLSGSASGGTPGNIAKPYRYVQKSDYNDTSAAMGASLPGDVIVMRAGTYQDLGFESYFVRFIRGDATACGGGRGSGLAPSATGGPITIMGYPGEDVFINMTAATGAVGGLSGLNGQSYPCAGQYINISNLRVESGGGDGPIDLEQASTGWRVVNNELTATTAPNTALAAGIAGDGPNNSYYGNYIHDIYCGSPGSAAPWPGPRQNHGIYVDGGGVNTNYLGGKTQGTYDIAYNYIYHVFGGYGLNVYNDANGTPIGVSTTANVHFHHNMIDGTGKGGINIADGAGSGIEVYDNIVVNAGDSSLRVNSTNLAGAQIFNNVFYHAGLNKDPAEGMFDNDDNTPNNGWDIENNIFVPAVSSPYNQYFAGAVNQTSSMGKVSNNLYFNGQGVPSNLDANAQTTDPNFVNDGTLAASGLLTGWDVHVQTGPAVNTGSNDAAVTALVGNDFEELIAVPPAGGYWIGAYQ